MDKKTVRWVPTGGMNMDAAYPLLPENNYKEAWHMRVLPGADGNGGMGRKLGGTLDIPWSPPPGDNTCIGMYRDPLKDRLVCFIHNSNGDHSIIWHHTKEQTARTVIIPELLFTGTTLVTGAAMFDGHLLAFTDGENPPRMIDLARADDTGKKSVVRLYIPPYEAGITSRSLEARMVVNGIPAPIFTAVATVSPQDVFDVRPMLAAFAQGLDTNLPANVFTADPCGGYIELTSNTIGEHTIEATVIDVINFTGVLKPCLVEHHNRYNALWDQWQINLATVVPVLPPSVSSRTDPDYSGGQVAGRPWQFCVAYRFKDNRVSPTGPISDVVVPALSVCGAATTPNTVDIDLSGDGWLSFPPVRGEIEDVNIYVREGDAGAWYLFKVVPKSTWAHTKVIPFRNDTVNPPADNTYVNNPVTYVPHTALALSEAAGNDDNQVLILGNVEEGDKVPCVQVEAHVDFEGNAFQGDTRGSVTGKVRIIRYRNTNSNYRRKQPIWKRSAGGKTIFGGFPDIGIPLAEDQEQVGQWFGKGVDGFVVYAAGTDLYDITRQVILPGPVTGLSFIGSTTVLDGSTTAKRQAIRTLIDGVSNSDIYSTFRIDGMEAGRTYIIRMADHQCGFFEDGDPEFDRIDNLGRPGLGWQGTSGNAFRFGPGTGPDFFEISVTIPPAGGIVDIGEILVADCPTRTCHRVWLLDNDTVDHSIAEDLRTSGYPAHLQRFQTTLESLAVPGVIFTTVSADPGWEYLAAMNFSQYVTTDHNGRAFIFGVDPSSGYDAAWVSASVSPNTFADNKWLASAGIYGDASMFTAQPQLSNTTGLHEYLVPCLTSGAHQRIMTNVVANYRDTSGAPVAGVLAVMQNGQFAISDAAGRVSIPAYVNVVTSVLNNSRDGFILARSGIACQMVVSPETNPFHIDPYAHTGNWSGLVNFVLPDAIVMIVGAVTSRCLARGGVYPLGIVCKRADGSRTPVKWIGDMVVPMHGFDLHDLDPFRWPSPQTYDNGLAVIDWEISGDVPIPEHGRFVSLQWVIGEESVKSEMLQWVAGKVVYATRYDEGTSTPIAAPSPAQATELYIDIGTGLTRKRAVTTGFLPGWSWEKGDRLRVLSDTNGTPLRQVVDMEITGMRGNYLVARVSSANPVMVGGEIIEVVRPGNVQTETGGRIYYEVPGWQVSINDPYGTPSWAATSGTLRGGDTWMLPTEVPWQSDANTPWRSKRVFRESRHPTDFTDDKSWGRGKIWVESPGLDDTRHGMRLRYSQVFRGGSKLNGLNIFNFGDYRTSDHSLGSIQVIANAGGVLFCICEDGSVSFYKTEQPIEVGADSSMKVMGRFLAANRISTSRLGTVHRKSVVLIPGGGVVFYDHRDGMFVLYNSNQPHDVAAPASCGSFFMERMRTMPEATQVAAGYDPFSKEIVVSFNAHDVDDGRSMRHVPGSSIIYHPEARQFVCRTLDSPDCWGTAGGYMWAFQGGRLWCVGHPSATPNLRFNIQRDLSVTFNAGNPASVTNPLAMSIWRGSGWHVSNVVNENGDISEIPPGMIKQDGGGLANASFMRDVTSGGLRSLSRGEYLMATSHLITLVHPGPEPCALILVDIGLKDAP